MKRSFADILATGTRILEVVLKPKYFWLGLLALSFIVRSGFALASPWRRSVTVWFPDYRFRDGVRSRSELRYIKSGNDYAETVASVIGEILLGPLEPFSAPIAITDARLNSVIRSGKTLYIDVSSSILFGRMNDSGLYGTPPLESKVVLGYMERSVRWNFPGMNVVFTIDGLEPTWETGKTKVRVKKK